MLGKVLTAKAAALAGVLVLTGGVASAATGGLPGPAQNAASSAAAVVGLHIPKSDTHDAEDGDEDGTEGEHADNHGDDVSTVAHDKSTEGRNHGAAVCEVASEGKCKSGDDESKTHKDKSADHRQDGDHSDSDDDDDEVTTPDDTTTTTVEDDEGVETEDPAEDHANEDRSGHHSGSDD